MLPAGFRQRDQTKKSPTGPFDREALQQHLEKLALEHEDREDLVPFTGEKKGGAAGVLSDTLPANTCCLITHKQTMTVKVSCETGKAAVSAHKRRIPSWEEELLPPVILA